ncbi:MAG TPA: amino acid ABC transporter permease [Castellaniella sp.]|uniref:amino acid ABC transporter permease n=1 Tax=Castellaniella sp. TaxID=1955812 RepID=UPI002EF10928
MAFELQFAPVLDQSPALIQAFWLTIKLSFAAIFLGGLLGLAVATARSLVHKRFRAVADLYVETIRNTPFLVQLYILFFGLPVLGILIPADVAGLLALTINLGAYSAEIFRAGVESVHRSQIEAGLSLSLTRWQVFVHVMLKPAVANVWPSLVSQFILTMLASSVCSFISVQELSGEAAVVQSQTFRSFEVYIVASLMYLALALILKVVLTGVGHFLFAQRAPRRKSSGPRGAGTGVRP